MKAMTALRMPNPRVTYRPAVNALVRLGALVAGVSLWVPVQAREFSLQARWGVGATLAAMSVALLLASFLRGRGACHARFPARWTGHRIGERKHNGRRYRRPRPRP